jgi:CheY-like chemotaxis protein
MMVAVSDADDRLRPVVETLEAWQDGDTIRFTPAGRRFLRVLVADDNRDAADALAMLVKIWGHDVRRAFDGAAAFDMTCAYLPDVLLLDIAMPQMDGCRLARQLRRQARFQDTLMVAVTGYPDKEHRLLSVAAGFDHYLVKPVDPSIVERLLRLRSARLPPSPAGPPVTPPKYGMLVVDDDEEVRALLNIGMRNQGFAVWLAACGQEALNLYRDHSQDIDVVLMDVPMPGLDGPQTLAALREINPRVRCCFMSGDLGSYNAWKLFNLGAAAVLRKPFHLGEVAQVLRDLVANGDGRASNR